VTDAKLSDIQKALKDAGIQVRSIIEVFKEEKNQEQPQEKQHDS